MERSILVESAKRLTQPQESAAKEFTEKIDRIASDLNQKMKNRPDLENLIGENNSSMMENDHHNFTRFMESIFYRYQAEVFVETVLWAMRSYMAHGFKQTYWSAELDYAIEILRNELSAEAFESVYPFYNWIAINIPICMKINEVQDESTT